MVSVRCWVLFSMACSSVPPEARIEIRGSDSEVNLVQRLGEAFMAAHPNTAVAVTGGGSGVGIAGIIDGTVDVANSSRKLKPAENLLALRRGVEPVATLFATDALCVVVHESNPVPSLTVDQLGLIFRGEVTDWSAFGGQGPIVAYGRQSSSGTYSFFRDAAVKGDYAGTVREMNGNSQIAQSVAKDPGGIGYMAVGYARKSANGLRTVPIAWSADTEPVDPLNKEKVLEKDKTYALARPLYQYTNGQPSGTLLEFLRFEVSEAGAVVVEEMGFYPLVRGWEEQNAHLGEVP